MTPAAQKMTRTDQTDNPTLEAMANGIVSAYVANNSVPIAELPGLIRSVHSAISGLSASGAVTTDPVVDVEKPTPAQIRKSIRDDGLVSFIDGKSYQTLKRHLTGHGLDPKGYRERFGLPSDYPMVAAGYAARRSELAKSIGLGRVGGQAERQADGKSAR